MKRILSFGLTLLLLISACGCGKESAVSSDIQPSSSSVQSENDIDSSNIAESNTDSGEATSADEDTELYRTIFESETAWLASLQLDNGAIPMTPAQNGAVTMNPYFADFAALALLDAADKYSAHVKKYAEWHFAHLNTAETDYNGVDGTIYDYKITVSQGKTAEESIIESDGKKSYDSTDSYAATFLTVLNKYYKATGDKEYILSRKTDIARVLNAMLATLDKGLTTAKPDYAVKYLMDNCEVYEGAVAAVSLFKLISDNDASYSDILKKSEDAAKQVSSAIENKLWNISGDYYEAGLFKNGDIAYTFSWDTYYPCATAQLFPIMSGLIKPESERAKLLYKSFCEHYDWQNFKIPDSFYWGSNVYTAAVMNDSERVSSYMTHYKKIIKKHAYPLYNADAAKVSMAAYIMLQNNS